MHKSIRKSFILIPDSILLLFQNLDIKSQQENLHLQFYLYLIDIKHFINNYLIGIGLAKYGKMYHPYNYIKNSSVENGKKYKYIQL
jgi:hypothetical protein